MCGQRTAGLLRLPVACITAMLESDAANLPVRCFLVLRCVSRLLNTAASMACHSLRPRRVQNEAQLLLATRGFTGGCRGSTGC